MRVVVLSDASRERGGWSEMRNVLEGAGHEVVDAGADAFQRGYRLDADGLVVGLNPVGGDTIRANQRLRVIAKPGSGVDNIDIAAATEAGILVCNTPGANAHSVADHVMAMLLALSRNLGPLDGEMRRGNWSDQLPPLVELAGKRIALIGTGHVGRAVARRAASFDMRMVAYDPLPDTEFALQSNVFYKPYPDVLENANVVSVHAPLNDQTRSMLGPLELRLLAPGAIVIAVSRGGVVSEIALADALRDGHLGGAGIDVWATEPCRQSPLFGLPNTVVTPHVAGNSVEASTRARIAVAENLLNAFAGRPTNVVNPEVLGTMRVRGGYRPT